MVSQGISSSDPRWSSQEAVRAGASNRPKWLLPAILVVWLALVLAGMGALVRYKSRPGPVAGVPAHWPAAAAILKDGSVPTLVMFAHPRCPCTRASIGELEKVMARTQGRVRAHVLFYAPGRAEHGWAAGDLWKDAERIPGVSVATDPDAGEARRFGVLTSGHTLVYAPNDALLFTGGITATRGHAGDNAGQLALIELLRTGSARLTTSKVFGCSLLFDDSAK